MISAARYKASIHELLKNIMDLCTYRKAGIPQRGIRP